jgi:hypothetical protein
MKKLTVVLSCIVMLCSSLPIFGWGQQGHDVVAAIAENNLSKKAKKALNEILEGKSIVYYSSWMDNVQNAPDWDTEYSHTKTWHYANVDKGYTYQTMPKNEKGDVITALNFLTKELTENIDNLSARKKADYVNMVVHLVGDLHCPMHAGRLSDRGGNSVKVKWFGQNTNLHSIFDSKMIDSARKWGYKEWVDQLDRKDKKFKKAAAQGTYEDWFMTTVDSAARIYDYVESSKKKEPNLSYQFVYDFSPLLEEQLLMGGYRLAHVLNTIFE